MAIKKVGPFSLRSFLMFYVFSLMLGTTLMILACFAFFSIAYRTGVVRSANQTELELTALRSQLETSENLNPDILPPDTTYVLFDKDFKVTSSNMSQNLQEIALNDYHYRNQSQGAYGYFMSFKRGQDILVVNYRLEASYGPKWMNRYLPNVNILSYSVMLSAVLVLFILITLCFAQKLRAALQPILKATQKITEQDLNFQAEKTGILEFNQVLDGLDDMRDALQESLLQTWQSHQEQEREISALTHDLKTPLTTVSGNLELMSLTSLTKQQQLLMENAQRGVGQLNQYVQELAEVTRLGQMTTLNKQDISLLDFVQTITVESQALSITKDVLLINEIPPVESRMVAKWDSHLLERAIMNIVANGFDYCAEKSELHLTWQISDHDCIFTCLDSGPGFSKEALEKGTQLFFQGDGSRHNRQHTGLGLAIANNIIQLHGGRLSLENDQKTGSGLVTVYLPLG